MSWTLALPLLGGIALVVQNALMIAMMSRGLGPFAALCVNSLVGLLLLATIELFRNGWPSFFTIGHRAEFWFLFPGLLGTFFVFANLKSFQLLGAKTSIVLVIAAQLLSGMVLDATGVMGLAAKPVSMVSLAGAAVLMVGVILVVQG